MNLCSVHHCDPVWYSHQQIMEDHSNSRTPAMDDRCYWSTMLAPYHVRSWLKQKANYPHHRVYSLYVWRKQAWQHIVISTHRQSAKGVRTAKQTRSHCNRTSSSPSSPSSVSSAAAAAAAAAAELTAAFLGRSALRLYGAIESDGVLLRSWGPGQALSCFEPRTAA